MSMISKLSLVDYLFRWYFGQSRKIDQITLYLLFTINTYKSFKNLPSELVQMAMVANFYCVHITYLLLVIMSEVVYFL